ncbi:kinase-like domain-containing protein [Whalleya microplaca]|nr:kinase-like domain-containing protein [Whalleya microplaca]
MPLPMSKHSVVKGTRTQRTSLHAGPLTRLLVVLIIKMQANEYLRHLWKKPVGLHAISNIYIKVKPIDNLTEAYAMQFVAQNTSIPVPKLYCAFVFKGRTYTVMKKIEGDMVGRGWENRTEESRKRILGQIRDMLDQLRSLNPPEGEGIASAEGEAFCDWRLPSKPLWGPFTTIRDFHEALINGINLDVNCQNVPPDLAELVTFYRQPFGKPVFSHGDLSKQNILVKGDSVVGIIDWETAGWLPNYWEYTCTRGVLPWYAFSQEEVDQFLLPMHHELGMDMIRRKYFDF